MIKKIYDWILVLHNKRVQILRSQILILMIKNPAKVKFNESSTKKNPAVLQKAVWIGSQFMYQHLTSMYLLIPAKKDQKPKQKTKIITFKSFNTSIQGTCHHAINKIKLANRNEVDSLNQERGTPNTNYYIDNLPTGGSVPHAIPGGDGC